MDSGAECRKNGSGGSSMLPSDDIDDTPDAEETCDGDRLRSKGLTSPLDEDEAEGILVSALGLRVEPARLVCSGSATEYTSANGFVNRGARGGILENTLTGEYGRRFR